MQPKEKIPIKRQSSEASEVAREQYVEKNVVARRGTSFGVKKMVANLTQKIHGGKHENVGL